MERMIYQAKRAYEKTKDRLMKAGSFFKEIRTSSSKYLVSKPEGAKKTSKVYLSENPRKDNACALKQHELGLIGQVGREMKKNYYEKEEGWLLDRVDSKMYVGAAFDMSNDFESEDIYEVDVNAAFQRAAKNMGLISEKTFSRFFELEDKPTQIMRKKKILQRYDDGSYFSGGQCLKYSKKCRLISSGSLASKKFVTVFKGEKIVDEYLEYNREEANLFFASGYEVGKLMFDIANELDGIYFWWVDAIFCKSDSVDKVQEYMKERGFESKVKKKAGIVYDARSKRAEVINDDGVAKPYFFSYGVSIDRHRAILDTEITVKEMLDKYKAFMELDESARDAERKVFEDEIGVGVEQKMLDMICKSFDIVSPNDMNARWLHHQLKIRGLSSSDFMRVKSVTMNCFKEAGLDDIFGEKEHSDLVTLEVVINSFDIKKSIDHKYKSEVVQSRVVDHKQLGRSHKKTYMHEVMNLSFLDNSLITLDNPEIGPKTKVISNKNSENV